MQVLFCGGSEKAPSWQMRAVQISSAFPNWQAISKPTVDQVQRADVVVLVKRVKSDLAQMVRENAKCIVWDAIDFWKQGTFDEAPKYVDDMVHLASREINRLGAEHVICANMAMQNDLAGVAKTRCIYHHARLDAKPLEYAPIIWYDGAFQHAPDFFAHAKRVFGKLGYEMRYGKPDGYGAAMIAFRDDRPCSAISQRWKSNVKAANAIEYDVPLFFQPENGCLETIGVNFDLVFKNKDDLQSFATHFHKNRDEIYCDWHRNQSPKRGRFTLENSIRQYAEYFQSL